MPHYFYLHDPETFHGRLSPALADCWRCRRWRPLDSLAPLLPVPPADSLLTEARQGKPFDRHWWQGVAGELLVLTAAEVPRLEIEPGPLCAMLGETELDLCGRQRSELTPMQQIFLGSRDVRFGPACYRPLHAGCNEVADVRRLTHYLASIDPACWVIDDLPAGLSVEDRLEELAYLQQGFAEINALYRRAAGNRWLVIGETMG